MSQKNDYTIVGIDGGGTHTRGILYRGGKVLAEAKSGTTRIGAVGVGESCERTLNVIIDLCSKAGIESSEIDALVVGLAGVWLEEEKKRSAALIRTLARSQDLVINDLMVTSDAEIALEGAFEKENGIMVIVGTGSIGLAKTSKNKLYRCGGWGIELDDEGSGAWIGREGLTAVVRSLDGRGGYTQMTEELGKMFNKIIDLDQPRTIVKAYTERALEYHMLTPSVMKCAENGDEVCLDIIERSADHLMELPVTLLKNYKSKKVKVALMGGVIEARTLLAKMLEEKIENHENLTLKKPKGSALEGAVAIGRRLVEEML